MTTPAPGLIAAAREAEYLFAHGVGSMSSYIPNSERNIAEAKRIIGNLAAALAALPPDAVIVPRSLLTEAQEKIIQLTYETGSHSWTNDLVKRLEQAAATKGAQT